MMRNINKKLISLVVAIIIVLNLLFFNTNKNTNYVEYHFKDEEHLKDHYQKHGIEMGFVDIDDYEEAASKVINNPNALCKQEKEDGDYVYYLEETNEIVFVSKSGYIRTYFNPNNGIAYFNKQ